MKKVMVFGVFDLLHPGHISFLKQAKELGDFLIVSVARSSNVRKFKGYSALQSEEQRMKAIKKLKFVNKVVLGGAADPWPHIKKEKPDLIALGYDQKSYISKQKTDNRKQLHELVLELRKHGLKTKVVSLKAYKPKIYKSSRLRNV